MNKQSANVQELIAGGKLIPASRLPEAVQLPSLIAPCDQCERDTPTKVIFMRQGFGNACAVCGRLRRGKPYLSKHDLNSLKPSETAKGGGNDELLA